MRNFSEDVEIPVARKARKVKTKNIFAADKILPSENGEAEPEESIHSVVEKMFLSVAWDECAIQLKIARRSHFLFFLSG